MTKKWLETRRSYLKKLKSQVELMSGPEDLSILSYSKSNKDLYKRVWDSSSEDDFYKKLSTSSIVLCGDFHSSPSVKRFYVRFFEKLLQTEKRQIVVALECFRYDQQENLDLWLGGRIVEESFLERVNWQDTWGFDWQGYKALILKLHQFGVKLVCINHSEEDFNKRDHKIAKSLVEVKNSFSQKITKDKQSDTLDPLTFCLIGQHHLGPENLFKNIKSFEPEVGLVTLHLDPEDLYFEVGHLTHLEEVLVLNHKDHFSFFSSPPWVHLQNHLMFLEEYLDEYEEERGFHPDLTRIRDYDLVVYDYIKLMCKDLNISVEDLKRVEVSSIDEYQVEGDDCPDDDELLEWMQPLLDSETSFYWPEQKEGIMVVSSLNHAASVAGKSIHAQMMGLKTLPWGEPDSFKVWSWLEAIGYFLSKFINPRRSPVSSQNLAAFLKARLGAESSRKIMNFLVQGRVAELKGHKFKGSSDNLTWNELIYASRLKGSLVGERLFELYLEGDFKAETIKNYMSLSVRDKEYFEPLYDLILERLNLNLKS